MLIRYLSFLRNFGPAETARKTLAKIGLFIARPGLRRVTAPGLSEMAATGVLYRSAEQLLIATSNATEAVASHLREEFALLRRELDGRYKAIELTHATDWAIEEQTSFFLYALVRLRAPEVVVETGVANGHSTFFLLKALHANGRGKLHSFDVVSGVGKLLKDDDKQRWNLRLLPAKATKSALESQLSKLAPIDLFIHDSDHSYHWQMIELSLALAHVGPNGVIASDDVDSSFAFLDFCGLQGLEPHLLLDGRKVFGLTSLSAATRRPAV